MANCYAKIATYAYMVSANRYSKITDSVLRQQGVLFANCYFKITSWYWTHCVS